MTKLEELQKKIQEEIPEIMELKDNCKITFKSKGIIHHAKILCKNHSGNFLIKVGNAITTTITINKVDKIIGRDITIEDVLVVLDKMKNRDNILLKTNCVIRMVSEDLMSIKDIYWKPNTPLHKQSEETISFLYNLICK